MTTIARQPGTLAGRGINGAIGGLIGGAAFGMLMGAMDMLPMVAMLVGSESALVGFALHMLISAAIGAGFGLAFGTQARSLGQGAGWGLLYGLIWWVLGPLVLMPLMMGMGLQFGAAMTQPMLMSLMGHLIFGALTGGAYAWLARR